MQLKKNPVKRNIFNAYLQMSGGIRQNKHLHLAKKTLGIGLLTGVLPIVSLAQGGCGAANGVTVNAGGGNGGAPLVNVNGGGNDFSFSAYNVNPGTANDFFLKRLNASFSIAYNNKDGSNYPEVAVFGNGANIGPGLNWSAGKNDFFRFIEMAYTGGGSSINRANWTRGTSGYVAIRRDAGGGDFNYGFLRVSVSSPISSGGSVTVDANLTGISDGTGSVTTGNCNSLLPVDLVSFTAKSLEKTIELNWVTAEELNNSGFEIQRSTDGKKFQTLFFVEGHGTTYEKQTYFYEDKDLKDGQLYYYRLKQIDFDGQFSLSKVVTAKTGKDYLTLGNPFPNPAKDVVRLEYFTDKETVNAVVFDARGQRIAIEIQSNDDQFLEMDFSNVAKGIYFVKVQAGALQQYRKIEILK